MAAIDRKRMENVVLKTYNLEPADRNIMSEAYLAALREAYAMRYRLRHPNVMALMDFVEARGHVVLVMDRSYDDMRNALYHCNRNGRHSFGERHAKRIF